MRTLVLAAAGLALGAAPALAASSVAFPGHEPLSRVASNIVPADTHSVIAPRLPAPPLSPNATAAQFLRVARTALHRHATGEAQEALERAETRLLDRSTAPTAADTPDSAPAIHLITQARDALGHRHWAQADEAIASALQTPAVSGTHA